MSSATAGSFGGFVPDPRTPHAHGPVDVRDKPASHDGRALVQRTPTYGGEPDVGKWPAWKVSLFVIVFCGAFWTLVYVLGSKLIQLLS